MLGFEPYVDEWRGLESFFVFAGGARSREPERAWTGPRARSHATESFPMDTASVPTGFWGLDARPGAPRARCLECLDPDEWMERHRRRLHQERPVTKRRHFVPRLLCKLGPSPARMGNLYLLTYHRLMSGTSRGTSRGGSPAERRASVSDQRQLRGVARRNRYRRLSGPGWGRNGQEKRNEN